VNNTQVVETTETEHPLTPIQFVDLKKQYAPLKTEILSGIAQVLDGMHLFLGENVQNLEKEFSTFCGAQYGIGVSEGTTALHLILRAMGIGPGDEVITVSHTFIATTEAIMLAGARPVFVDIDPQTMLMDVSQIEGKITSHTKAILPVHLYGQVVDLDPLLDIAYRHHLRVVEDACQAHGASYKGRRAGSIGDAGAFSFYYSKNLGGYGEGGFITTNDAALAQKIRILRDHGSETRYHHDVIGFNARLDEIQAVILRTKLLHLAQWNRSRREHAALYDHLLQDTPVKPPFEADHGEAVYHLYVIQTLQRDDLQAYLKDRGIFTGVHYPIPIHLQKAAASLGYKKGDLPVTEQMAQSILSLPMYAELEDAEIEYVAGCVKSFFDD
jgi:dTDP-4-amino-4,6-dideoxygalactose transaminase